MRRNEHAMLLTTFVRAACAAPRAAAHASQVGASPKCHPQYRFCLGEQRTATARAVYCYGSTGGCLWESNACAVDSDCAQYSAATTQKYTDGTGWPAATYCADPAHANDWPFPACGYVVA
jgi:hypothetical protein